MEVVDTKKIKEVRKGVTKLEIMLLLIGAISVAPVITVKCRMGLQQKR